MAMKLDEKLKNVSGPGLARPAEGRRSPDSSFPSSRRLFREAICKRNR